MKEGTREELIAVWEMSGGGIPRGNPACHNCRYDVHTCPNGRSIICTIEGNELWEPSDEFLIEYVWGDNEGL